MKTWLCIFIAAAFSYNAIAQTDTFQQTVIGRYNSREQQAKPYVILISIDGYRHDYTQKFNATTLHSFSNSGVRAASMIPSFPSLTFPNHYTIVTGLYPSHHGIVNNNFYDALKNETYSMNKLKVRDKTWYGGTPLWVLAEQQNMVTASFYWVGSEAPIKDILPTYFYYYSEKISMEQRIQAVVNWLKLPEEKRPHLITFYFPEVDHAGHDHGPDAAETEHAVKLIDSSIQQLTEAVKQTGLPVNFIVVSDHGMTKVDQQPVTLPAELDTSKFYIPSEGNVVEMYARDKADIIPAYHLLKRNENKYKVYLKTNVPIWWHYSEKDDIKNRIGDILIIPEWPKVFNLKNRKINIGWHGYDAYKVKDMHAIFYAWGPAFKKQMTIPFFENVHVYPLVAKILGLKITEKIDGNIKVLNDILK